MAGCRWRVPPRERAGAIRVNPDAPKGGTLVMPSLTDFDTLSPLLTPERAPAVSYGSYSGTSTFLAFSQARTLAQCAFLSRSANAQWRARSPSSVLPWPVALS